MSSQVPSTGGCGFPPDPSLLCGREGGQGDDGGDDAQEDGEEPQAAAGCPAAEGEEEGQHRLWWEIIS